MSQKPDDETEKHRVEEWSLDLGTYSLDLEGYGAETDCSLSPANDNSNGGFESLGNLSSRVLNRLRIEGGDQSGDGRESRSGLLTGGEVVASKRNLL